MTTPVIDNKTCQGRCIIEMQKMLEPSVVTEFFEVIRDFHNDEKTAIKLKNIILSETSEAVKLLNERASEMIMMVDEMFLIRRQRQSSFYRLCHKLARKGLPEGSNLPDESKCVCFSAENLRKFNVDPGANTSLSFASNLVSIKEALKQYFGELQCTNCGRQLCRSGNMMSSVCNCSCSSPSVTSQHNVHEAILELSKTRDDKMCQDAWYLTQLKRDADYYMNRCRASSISSDESVKSFEIISCSNQENDAMDNESVGSNLSIQEGMLYNCDNKFSDPPKKSESLTTDIQNFSKTLNNKLMHSFSFTTNLTDARKRNPDSECNANKKSEADEKHGKKLSPAAVLRQSFSPYFDRCSNAQIPYRFSKRNDDFNSTVCPAEHLRHKLQKLHVNSKSIEFQATKKVVDLSHNKEESTPSDFLKSALNSYLKKEVSENWLRN